MQPFILLSFVLLFFLPACKQETTDTATTDHAAHKPQIYNYDGTPVDPLCFLNNIGTEDKPIYPTRFCVGEELAHDGKESPLDDRFVSASYSVHHYDHETEESSSYNGFIGYRAIGQVDYKGKNYLALVLVENGGGSGTFTSIMLLDPQRDEDEKTINFHRREIFSFGDRCMGGYKDAWVEDGVLYYRLHTTMIDMLSLIGDPEREILQSKTAGSLPGCAPCCYAQIEYSTEDDFRGVFFAEDRMKPDENDSEAARCVENLVDLNVTQAKQDYFGKEDFGFFVREIEHTCLGAVEGE